MSSVEARISGVGKLLAKLGSIENVVYPVIAEQLELGALAIHSEAVKSIYAHESQGRTYGNHVASAPGYPPNSDTGTLARSIQFSIDKESLTAVVGSNLEYARFLEIGTQNIKARPWLFPAFENNRERIKDGIVQAIRDGLRGSA